MSCLKSVPPFQKWDKMDKVIVIDASKCTGCRLCELVCSVMHNGTSNPYRSRIKIKKFEKEGIFLPTVCQHCDSPPCIDACPTGTRFKDATTGRTLMDPDRCIVCQTCTVVCPFGGVTLDPVEKNIISCDLCGGDPVCVKFCETGALKFVEKQKLPQDKRLASASLLVRKRNARV